MSTRHAEAWLEGSVSLECKHIKELKEQIYDVFIDVPIQNATDAVYIYQTTSI